MRHREDESVSRAMSPGTNASGGRLDNKGGGLMSMWFRYSVKVLMCAGIVALYASVAPAATYEVGTDKSIKAVADVPWESLRAGDTVLLYWRKVPYKTKWVVNGVGTETAPITVRGVPGPGGELPVITGDGASTPAKLKYWGEARGILKIGGSKTPDISKAAWIVIESIEVRGAKPEARLTDRMGQEKAYAQTAAAIWVESGEHVTIRNCIIRNSCNGIVASSATKDITIEGCYFEGNGLGLEQHQSYTLGFNTLYQYNKFGPLRPGAPGNAIKDRSAGCIVRYNWVEYGGRQLDLVEAIDSDAHRDDPQYHKVFVYGNVICEHGGSGNNQMIHFGGDMGNVSWYRRSLYFYNNTVVSDRTTDNTSVFRLMADDETVYAANNIFYSKGNGARFSMRDGSGRVILCNNWLSQGWRATLAGAVEEVQDGGGNITGASPGFVNEATGDFRLAQGSPCIDAGGALHESALPDNAVTMQYVKDRQGSARPNDGKIDIGAFEYAHP